ncbi:MAG: hypothetical protein ACRYGR_09660 [Janthinobacterium lividum]
MVKRLGQKILTVIALASSAMASEKAIQQFEAAWQNPSYTQIQLEDVDINKILNEHYETSRPLHFTREML